MKVFRPFSDNRVHGLTGCHPHGALEIKISRESFSKRSDPGKGTSVAIIILSFFLSFSFSFFFFLVFLGPHLRHMEVPRLGVKLEL